MTQELSSGVPTHLNAMWSQDCWCLHSPGWWRQLWERTGLVDVEVADLMPDGWRFWHDWHQQTWPDNTTEIAALDADQGEYLGYVRMGGRRRHDVRLEEYAWPDQLRSFPQVYEYQAFLRSNT